MTYATPYHLNPPHNMPIHIVPVAIVLAKVSASAVVSLSPAAMAMEQQDGQQQPPRTRVRDLFKPSFYKKEFARLENEKVSRSPPALIHISPQESSSSFGSTDSCWDHTINTQSSRFRTIHRQTPDLEMV